MAAIPLSRQEIVDSVVPYYLLRDEHFNIDRLVEIIDSGEIAVLLGYVVTPEFRRRKIVDTGKFVPERTGIAIPLASLEPALREKVYDGYFVQSRDPNRCITINISEVSMERRSKRRWWSKSYRWRLAEEVSELFVDELLTEETAIEQLKKYFQRSEALEKR